MAAKRSTARKHRGHEDDLQRDDRGAGHEHQKSKKEIDKELDKALEDSFPSSDPPSHSQPTPTGPAGDPEVKP